MKIQKQNKKKNINDIIYKKYIIQKNKRNKPINIITN